MPSAAKAASYAGTASMAASASARWMTVSCACRQAQNASGDGAGRKVQQSRSTGAARVPPGTDNPRELPARSPLDGQSHAEPDEDASGRRVDERHEQVLVYGPIVPDGANPAQRTDASNRSTWATRRVQSAGVMVLHG